MDADLTVAFGALVGLESLMAATSTGVTKSGVTGACLPKKFNEPMV